MAEFLGDQLCGVGVDHVGDLVHRALAHQQTDDVDRALRHAVGEFLNGDRFRNRHLADQLLLLLIGRMALEALGAAAERGDRALAHVVGGERGDDGQAAALLLRTRLVRGLRRRRRTRSAAGTTADLARTLIILGTCGNAGRAAERTCARGTGGCRACAGGLCPAGARAGADLLWPAARCALRATWGLRRTSGSCDRGGLLLRRGGRRTGRLAFTEPLLGLELGLALGFLFLTVALFLGLAARLGSLALGAFGGFALGAAAGFLFGLTALFHVADARVGERAGAGRTLILGQGAQHHAGSAALRRAGTGP